MSILSALIRNLETLITGVLIAAHVVSTPVITTTSATIQSQIPLANDNQAATIVINTGNTEAPSSISQTMLAGASQNPTQSIVPSNQTISTNSAACVEIAQEAAVSEVGSSRGMPGILAGPIVPTQAYFKNGDCFYELTYSTSSPSPSYVRVIHYAPNDGFIASCNYSKSGVLCYSGGSSITEAVFHLIEAQYLSN
ncbi:MAG: hypothetical protein KGI60_01695 [Patescibacteria group bacterium]|nr:hypothetical protein [Patescibacteria group bacterium]